MAPGLILETTFLIDLERELLGGEAGPAHGLLERNREAPLAVTLTTLGELAAGARASDRTRWEELVRPFEVLPCTPDVCWRYGQTYRYLKTNGLLIGTNDLWIGATALVAGRPLVTRNVGEFRRIPGLEVMDYAA